MNKILRFYSKNLKNNAKNQMAVLGHHTADPTMDTFKPFIFDGSVQEMRTDVKNVGSIVGICFVESLNWTKKVKDIARRRCVNQATAILPVATGMRSNSKIVKFDQYLIFFTIVYSIYNTITK